MLATRRGFLVSAGAGSIGAACAPGPAPVVPSPTTGGATGWEREWEELVRAARAEGKLTLFLTGVGAGFRKFGEEFEAAFPGIATDVTNAPAGVTFLPKILQERQAGIYNWDVVAVQAPFSLGPDSLRPNGVLDPVRPLLFRPDVLDDKAWPGGFEGSWIDNEKRWSFVHSWGLFGLLWINTDLVKEGEITSGRDLTGPKWKGKIISSDPRVVGGGFIPATVLAMKYGFDILKTIWVDQQAVLTREPRQVTEGLVRGKYAMGFGVNSAELQEFLEQGVGKNVKRLVIDSAAPLMRGVSMVNRAPHPNAAKLFLNWLLTKEGQTSYSKNSLHNARRRDAPVADETTWVDPDKQHPMLLDTEEMMNKPLEVTEYFKKLLV